MSQTGGLPRPKATRAVYTVAEAAAVLKLKDKKDVTALIEEGKLPAINVGFGERRFFRIPISAVERFARQKKASSRP